MRLSVRRARGGLPGTITGTVRVDRPTKRLAGRLRPGDVALIDHLGLDRSAAEVLIAARVTAVLNASPSISGRFPTLGPQALVRAGIQLVDDLGDGVFQELRDGDRVTLHGNAVLRNGTAVAHGVRQDADTVARAMAVARDGLAIQLEALGITAAEYVRRELLSNLPPLRTMVAGRPCLVVLRRTTTTTPTELDRLTPWLADARPVLIGVDGGADALLAAGHRPDLVVGHLESVSDAALRCGAEIVVRSGLDGHTPCLPRLGRHNLRALAVPTAATPEDFGLLLAHAAGASLIVAVGGHAGLAELLDQGRAGAASAFLTRLKLGATLVDGATVARLHRTRASTGAVVGLAAAGVTAMVAGVLATTVGVPVVDHVATWWDTLFGWL